MHRERGRRGIVVNRCSVLAQAQRARRLLYLPRYVFRRRGAVRPFIVGLRLKRRRVGSRIGSGRGPGHGHFGGIIVIPGRRLRAAGIPQCPPLGRNRQAADTGDPAGLISGRQIVRTFRHLDGNGRRTGRLLGHCNRSLADRHRSDIGIAGLYRDRAVPGPIHCEGCGCGVVVDRCSVLAQGQRPGRLAYLPRHIYRIRGTILPAIAGLRCELRNIASRVDPGRYAGHRHLIRLVIVPFRILRIAVIGQRPLLGRLLYHLDRRIYITLTRHRIGVSDVCDGLHTHHRRQLCRCVADLGPDNIPLSIRTGDIIAVGRRQISLFTGLEQEVLAQLHLLQPVAAQEHIFHVFYCPGIEAGDIQFRQVRTHVEHTAHVRDLSGIPAGQLYAGQLLALLKHGRAVFQLTRIPRAQIDPGKVRALLEHIVGILEITGIPASHIDL